MLNTTTKSTVKVIIHSSILSDLLQVKDYLQSAVSCGTPEVCSVGTNSGYLYYFSPDMVQLDALHKVCRKHEVRLKVIVTDVLFEVLHPLQMRRIGVLKVAVNRPRNNCSFFITTYIGKTSRFYVLGEQQ